MKKEITIVIVIITILVVFSGCIEEKKPEATEKTTSDVALEFMNVILDRDLNSAYDYFSSIMKDQFSYAQFESTWSYIESTYGDFESIKDSSESVEDGYDIVFVNCTFTKDYYIIFKI